MLTAANTHTGTTTITAGTLQLGAGGTTGSIASATVVNNGTLAINRSDDLTLATAISGTGTIRKDAANALTLTGAVSGQNLLVNSGTLNVTAGGALGTITSAGTLNVTAASTGALTIAAATTATIDAAVTSSATVVDGSLVLTGGTAKNSTLTQYSGAGLIVNAGAGTTTLVDSTANFTGTVRATAGTVAFGDAASLDTSTVEFNGGKVQYTGASAITLTNALTSTAALSFLDLAATGVTWNGAVSGSGTIRVTGVGATSLTVGTTAITNGTHVVGGVTFEANTFDLGGIAATAGITFVNAASALDVTNSGALATFTVDQTGTAAGTVSGAVTLVKSGASNLTLTGGNTYTGGTTVSGGTLTLGGDTVLGTGAVTLAGGTLAAAGSRTLANAVVVAGDSSLGGSGALTITGALTGAAKLTQSATGTTTLTNAAGFTGTYGITAGTLALNGGAGTTTLTNGVTGAGTFALTGTGTTKVTTSVLNAATTTVSNGTLDLGGNAAVAQLTALSIASGATLKGQGTVSSLTNAGTVAPGNSPGIVVVTGNFTNSGTLKMEIAGTGAAGAADGFDQIQVGGTATLGGTLAIDFIAGPIAGNHSYRLISGTTLTGAFATTTLTQNGFVTPLALPAGQHTIFTTDATGFVFTTFDTISAIPGVTPPSGVLPFSSALTANTTAFNAVLATLSAQGPAAATQALVNASPIGLGAMTSLAVDEAQATTELMRTRLDAQRRTTSQAIAAAPWVAYANVTGSQTDVKNGEDNATYDRSHYGAKGGLERSGRDGIALGGNLGYDTGKASFHNGGGSVSQDHLSASGYISHKFNKNTYMYLGAFAGTSLYDTSRNTVNIGGVSKNTGDTRGWDLGLAALFGRTVTLGKSFELNPYAGVTYTHAQTSAYTESGNALALTVDQVKDNSLRSKLGTDIDWIIPNGDSSLRLGLGVVWEHELLNDEVKIPASFANGSPGRFTTASKTLANDTIGFGPNATVLFGEGNAIRLAYQYQYGFGDETGHRVDLTFTKRF